jgi:hypothetical protein
MTVPDHPLVVLEPWAGPWSPHDPDANFKRDVALYSQLDPMTTIAALSASMQIPAGAIVRYVLARYASAGSGGLLELGPSMVHRLWEPVDAAERAGDDVSRLAAYDQLRQMISWLRQPLLGEGEDDGGSAGDS